MVLVISTGAVFASSSPERAGAVECYAYQVARHLRKVCLRAYLLDFRNKKRYENNEVSFIEMPNPPIPCSNLFLCRLRSLLFALLTFFYLPYLMRKYNFKIIHNNSQFTGFLLSLAKKLLNLKVHFIHTTHNPYLLQPTWHSKLMHIMEIITISNADIVIAHSRSVADALIRYYGVNPSKIKVIYHGLDMEEIYHFIKNSPKNSSDSHFILNVGRICPRKNQIVLIKAAVYVLKKFPDVKFLFIGPIEDKKYFASLQKIIIKKGISKNVIFSGEVNKEELYALYNNALMFVLPSFAELGAQALREAMAFGLPILASKIPPIMELDKMKPGMLILFNPVDERELSEKIILLLQDETLRHEMSSKVRNFAQNFAWFYVIDKYVEIYKNCLDLK